MAKKTTPAPSLIPLSPTDVILFETFLQYGDLANANLIFMGMEEGLDGGAYRHLTTNQLYSLAIAARKELL